jgi:hypothetical protein
MVHSMSQKRATRHLLHSVSLREAPQQMQHTDVTSASPQRRGMLSCSAVPEARREEVEAVHYVARALERGCARVRALKRL